MSVQARVSRLGVIRRYREWLPEIPDDAIATIGEGDTPLIEAKRISARVGARLFLKFEGMNPTASFKDRGMTVAMSRAVAAGSRACVCASTGTTAASAAAYATQASQSAASAKASADQAAVSAQTAKDAAAKAQASANNAAAVPSRYNANSSRVGIGSL